MAINLGNNSNSNSPQITEALKRIRAGDTESARRAGRFKRIVGASVQAAGAIGHAALDDSGDEARRRKAQSQRDAVTNQAISKAKAASAQIPQSQPGQESQASYMQNAYSDPLERKDPYADDTKAAVKTMADEQLNHIAVNDAAENAPIRNTWGNGPAFANASANAEGLGTDINTSRNMMKQGGMMGSVNTGIDRQDPYAPPPPEEPYDESKEF